MEEIFFRELLKNDDSFYVPEVIDSLSTRRVLTTEFVYGSSLDKNTKWSKNITNKVRGLLVDLYTVSVCLKVCGGGRGNWKEML